MAWAFLDSFIGLLFVISFFRVRYRRASFFGGEPPPVMRISVGVRAMAAEH